MSEKKFDYEKEGVRIIISGKLEVLDVYLNPNLEIEKQEELVKECFNEAVKKVQLGMAQEFSGMSQFGL